MENNNMAPTGYLEITNDKYHASKNFQHLYSSNRETNKFIIFSTALNQVY